MPIVSLLLAAQAVLTTPTSAAPPACSGAQLRLSLDARDGDFNGMSHSGTELSIRNTGPDCTLAGLPTIQMRDARGRVLTAIRQKPVGMYPGPVVLPVRLGGGHRAVTNLRWVSGPTFPQSRSVHATMVTVRIGKATLRAPLSAVLYGDARKPVTFEQAPLRAMEGMAAG
ncbi:DUF4232 domain-containing protein [Sphingomonas sp. PAMC 26605]|uniref:DUF4232 domain-containing protein n=1 Tax=Sphingomonas sp. PAMC 26605 TaxID=1112214 RepID=UPI00026CACEC|nr:DUF4232 domain-containing protein [Sphingomonas sp. PAMC 26605]